MRRYLEPRLGARALVWTYLASLVASAGATLLLLLALMLRYLPHEVLSKAGLSCQMDNGCATGLPYWADAGFSFMVGGVLAGLVLFIAFAVISQAACSRRARTLLVSRAELFCKEGLSGRLRGRTLLIDDPNPRSYTIGFVRSRVVVSTGLLDTLEDEEIEAVLAHEEGHVAACDNVINLLAHTVVVAFAALPGVRVAYSRLRRAQEIAADEFARGRTGDGLLVASSLQKFARSLFSPRPLAAGVGFADDGHVAERIRGLLVEDVVATSKRYLALTIVAVALLFTAFAGSAMAFTGVTLASRADCAACHGSSTAVGVDATIHGSCTQ